MIFRILAFEDSEWKAINQKTDMFYAVESLPVSICHALMPSLAPGENLARGYARAEHLLGLRHFVQKQPLAPTERITAWAETLLQEEAEAQRLLEEKERKKRPRTKEGEQSNRPADKLPDQPVSTPEEKATSNPGQFVLVVPKRTVQGSSTDDLLMSSPVAQTKIIRSTSSKLNYILEEVRKPRPPSFDPYTLLQVLAYSKDEKFLIFSNSPLTLAMVSDALQLIQVHGLLCSSHIKPAGRFQRIVTFESSDTYRVLLMELKHGARGL